MLSYITSTRAIKWGVAAAVLLVVGLNCYTTVPTGHVGVQSTFGEVNPQPLLAGFHPVNPLSSITKINVRLVPLKVEAHSGSHDLQKVTGFVTVPYSINEAQAARFYMEVGTLEDLKHTILEPGIQESVKAVTAQFSAEQLVKARDQVRITFEDTLKTYVAKALKDKGVAGAVDIGGVTIDNLDFSPKFQAAIEAKVKAGQDAERARQDGKKIVTEAEAEAEQIRKAADGEAYTVLETAKKEADAIVREAAALRSNPDLVELTAINRWKGKLPRWNGAAPMPFTAPIGR